MGCRPSNLVEVVDHTTQDLDSQSRINDGTQIYPSRKLSAQVSNSPPQTGGGAYPDNSQESDETISARFHSSGNHTITFGQEALEKTDSVQNLSKYFADAEKKKEMIKNLKRYYAEHIDLTIAPETVDVKFSVLAACFDSLINTANSLVSNPSQFAVALGVLTAANSTISMLHLDIQNDESNLKQWSDRDTKQQEWETIVVAMKKIISKSGRIQHSQDVCLASLFQQLARLEWSIIAIPDPDLLKKSLVATSKMVGGLVQSALTFSLNEKLISGSLSAIKLGSQKARRVFATQLFNKYLRFEQLGAIVAQKTLLEGMGPHGDFENWLLEHFENDFRNVYFSFQKPLKIRRGVFVLIGLFPFFLPD